MRHSSFRFTAFFVAVFILCAPSAECQARSGTVSGSRLHFVIYLNRHGVRSPTSGAGRYGAYSASAWPEWSVAPGYLTAHGFVLMKLFGAYDRAELAAEGLLAPEGCADAPMVTIVADSDERTRETAKALAEGMFPACPPAIHALAEGTPDALFHSMRAGVGKPDRALAQAAIEGRIGGNANNPTQTYRPQLEVLDRILAGCGKAPVTNPRRKSIFDAPVESAEGKDDHAADLRGPLSVASSMAETLLLEYTEGMRGAELGWGCMDEARLREIMQLHTADADYSERTPAMARMDASNLLEHIVAALEQSAKGKAGGRALFLVGHDTNIATVAGLLDLDWILDGRADDTPPGGALVFELWRSPAGEYSVRVYYTAQTLDQMRGAQRLTPANPPDRVPVFVPGCSRADMSCTLAGFAAAARRAIDPAYVSAQP